jgi:hypothetical protein
MKRYLLVWLTGMTALLLVVAAFNAVVDPYGLFRWIDHPGFNHIKPAAADRGPMTKAYQVLRVQPRTLVLGNSRAELGLDPNDPAWPPQAQPVYNLALPGTGTATSLHYLQHVLAATADNPTAQPTLVVWGIDLMDFLTDPHAVPGTQSLIGGDLRLLLPGNTVRWQQQVRDHVESTLTMNALLDSLTTLVNQRNPYAIDLTPQGFNPMREYTKISQEEGYWAIFRQRDQDNIRAFLRRPNNIYGVDRRTSPRLDDLKEVIHLCRQNGIELRLFTYPYHAHLLEIFRITGHWSAFEEWKRAIVQILAEESATSGKPAFELWDFSELNAYTTETVPAQGDRRSSTRWYWESGHFKNALGSLMLQRMLNHTTQPVDLGVLLTSANLDTDITTLQSQALSYRSSHSQELAELERFKNQMVTRANH